MKPPETSWHLFVLCIIGLEYYDDFKLGEVLVVDL